MNCDAVVADLVSRAFLIHESFLLPLLAVCRSDHSMHLCTTHADGVQVPNHAVPEAEPCLTRIAFLPEQRRAAQELVCRRYAWRGYKTTETEDFETPQPEGMPLVLVAERRGHLSGTLTVRADSQHGILAENSYAAEINAMRASGRRLGELVKLAVENGADWKATMDALVQAAYVITRKFYALTDVLIEVNPRHVKFYERVFGFVVAAAERVCSRVGAPSVLMRLDLEHFGRKLELSRA